MKQIIDLIYIQAEKFGVYYLIGGVFGAIVNRMRRRMTWAQFFASLILAMFVGWSVGVSLTHIFNLQPPFIYVFCSMAGAFSEDLLTEAEKLVKSISEWIKTKYMK